jgi:mannitol 2-dehydrogenase
MSIKLTQANLAQIGQSIIVPSYDRSKVTAGIVHIGLGNF